MNRTTAAVLLALAASGCAGPSFSVKDQSRYNLTVRGDSAPSLSEVNASADVYTERIAPAAKLSVQTAREVLASQWFLVRYLDAPIPCAGTAACDATGKTLAAGELLANPGKMWGNEIDLYLPCAFWHELGHALKMAVSPPVLGSGGKLYADADPLHTDTNFWAVSDSQCSAK